MSTQTLPFKRYLHGYLQTLKGTRMFIIHFKS